MDHSNDNKKKNIELLTDRNQTQLDTTFKPRGAWAGRLTQRGKETQLKVKAVVQQLRGQ